MSGEWNWRECHQTSLIESFLVKDREIDKTKVCLVDADRITIKMNGVTKCFNTQ